ncbi:MAG: hypothetical protein REI78_02580 [Pedobacter sp.]|nr:hypothetical protein [Pedobacter sp.]MDQ8051878.1 hypothetical protein [Pedobacter sp.]
MFHEAFELFLDMAGGRWNGVLFQHPDRSIELRPVDPEAVEILAGYGTIITLEEAEIMLGFLHNFVKLALDQQLNEIKGLPHPEKLRNNVTK